MEDRTITTQFRIVNTGNSEGDTITVKQSGLDAFTLQRGEVSGPMGATAEGHMLHISGTHGQGGYKGECDVFCGAPMAPQLPDYHYPPGSFEWALSRLREGQRVSRRGWSGKGQYVYLVRPDNPRRGMVQRPYFIIVNVPGEGGLEQPGWVPSVGDCLADDWEDEGPNGSG